MAHADATHMTLEVAAGDEIRERELLERGCAGVGEGVRRLEGAEERRRHDEPTDAQRGEEDLRGGPGVEHAAVVIERLEAFERMTLEAELAVVIVLEDVGGARVCPREERESTRQRQ